MKKSIIAVTLILPLLVILAFSPIIANQAFAQNQMGAPIMSPRQQPSTKPRIYAAIKSVN